MSALRLSFLVALLSGLSDGCIGSNEAERPVALSVFAASSLTEAFETLAAGFEAAHPDIDVVLTFAGSQVLRLQIEQGAAADVFASANEAHMRALQARGDIVDSRTFAENELVVIVPPDASARIERFEQLARAHRIVLGATNVPVGVYAQHVLRQAETHFGPVFSEAVRNRVVSEESNVRLVRAKVELGEADAAIVYRTDAHASGRVEVIDIPAPLNVRARYPMGVAARSERRKEAIAFIDYILSSEGADALRRHGFAPVNP